MNVRLVIELSCLVVRGVGFRVIDKVLLLLVDEEDEDEGVLRRVMRGNRDQDVILRFGASPEEESREIVRLEFVELEVKL